jgi:hypothetical protein
MELRFARSESGGLEVTLAGSAAAPLGSR